MSGLPAYPHPMWDRTDPPRYYDMDGNVLSMRQWVESMEGDFENTRRVAQTERGEYHVSTVLLGIDHGFSRGPPIIFETMIFGGVFSDAEYQTRYATREEAEAGHAQACKIAFSPLRRWAYALNYRYRWFPDWLA